MPSRRRSRTKNLGTNLADVQRRMRYLERRPVRTKLQRKVVTAEIIAPETITPDEVSFPTITVETGDPTTVNLNPVQGDLNIDPTDGSSSYYDENTNQYESLLAVDPVAQENAATALTTADGKNAIYCQTSPPTGGTYAVDDLWFDTDDGNKVYRWTGTAWVSAQDAAIEAARLAAVAAKTSADGKNTIYRQTTVPTGGTYAVGDTWFDTDDGNAIYRYAAGATATVSNKALTSNVATLTTSAAHSFTPGESVVVTSVDATFNGTYTVISVPTTTTLTYARTATNVTAVASTGTITSSTGWKAIVLGDSALVSISANKLTAGTIDASKITVSNLDAGSISTGTLSADRIAANSLDVNKLTAGELRSGTIYTGNVVASQITTGTITAAVEMTSATITGGLIRTAASGARIEIKANTDSNRILFWGSGTSEGAISVNDYRLFMYSPGSTYGAGAYIALYGDQASSANTVSINGGPSNTYVMSINSTGFSFNRAGGFGLRINSNAVVADGAAGESFFALRNVRITTVAPTSGGASSTTDGNFLLVREA